MARRTARTERFIPRILDTIALRNNAPRVWGVWDATEWCWSAEDIMVADTDLAVVKARCAARNTQYARQIAAQIAAKNMHPGDHNR
jgi:hypothetical protein